MKPKTTNPVSLRCIHRTPAGRQCRRFAADAHSALCPQHRAEQNQVQAADHYLHLTRRFHDFQTAQGINHSLHNLYELLAQNRISTRRAAVLAYIGSLLLRTLPQIDADNAAGIKYQPKKLDAAAITDSPEAFECSRPRIRTREDLGYLHSGARPQQETVMTNAEFAR